MSLPALGLLAITAYFIALISLAFYRARSATIEDYLIGSRNSTWWLITLGMISDSVSGVTYISVPGMVSIQSYAYLQIVMGYFFGYLVIAFVLLPVYYRLNLISIYAYLGTRFGPASQKTASFLFIASRLFGSAGRLYLAVIVLHHFLFEGQFSPAFTFFGAMALIILYTYKGGIKSLVWTEAFQSLFLIAGIGIIFFTLYHSVNAPLEAVLSPKIFFWDGMASNFFLKYFIGGMFITISLNGLDQNIMQINLSCKSLAEAKKNMIVFAFVILVVNAFFVSLGSLVLAYYRDHALPLVSADQLLPNLVFHQLGTIPVLFFILGLAAATFSSAGSILPALASSIEIDLLPKNLRQKIHIRALHVGVGLVILGIIYFLYLNKTESLIGVILRYAGYTYGPLLGLFALGIFTNFKTREKAVPLVAFVSIVSSAILDRHSSNWFSGYHIGIELILINAILFTLLITICSLPRFDRR